LNTVDFTFESDKNQAIMKRSAKPKPDKGIVLDKDVNKDVETYYPHTDAEFIIERLKNNQFVSFRDRVSIALIFERNNFDVNVTSKELGIEPVLIKKYHAQVINRSIDEVNDERIEYMREVQMKVMQEIREKDSEFIKQAFDVKSSAMVNLQAAVESCYNVRDLTQLIKVLHDITSPTNKQEGQEGQNDNPATGKAQNVLLEIALNQINHFNINKKK